MNDSARIAELQEQVFRLTETLRAILARSDNWRRPAVSEYYKAGQLSAFAEMSLLAAAGLRWAEGRGEEPE
jgi:hypothetical protein